MPQRYMYNNKWLTLDQLKKTKSKRKKSNKKPEGKKEEGNIEGKPEGDNK